MSLARFHTFGALVRDLRALRSLGDGLGPAGSFVVLARRRDARVAEAVLPEAEVVRVESGLSRRQWLEFGSMYFAATASIFLIGAIHLPTGLVSQALLTLCCVVGLFLYHRKPQLGRKLSAMALPDRVVEEWEARFGTSFAVVLVTVPGKEFEEAQDIFLGDGLEAPFATDRTILPPG
jgi:hypothetical protein